MVFVVITPNNLMLGSLIKIEEKYLMLSARSWINYEDVPFWQFIA